MRHIEKVVVILALILILVLLSFIAYNIEPNGLLGSNSNNKVICFYDEKYVIKDNASDIRCKILITPK